MKIDERPEAIVIKTTDIQLPQGIGETLRHAHYGELGCTTTKKAISFA